MSRAVLLPEADLTALRAIVESSSFEEEMTNGFACQGGKKDHHYTWRITFLADERSASGTRSTASPESPRTRTPRASCSSCWSVRPRRLLHVRQ